MHGDHSTGPAKGSKSKKKRPPKLKKPHPDFPLTPHRSGQWCKKILGKIHYFGRDADEALKRWLDEKDDLLAGRVPRSRSADPGAARLGALVNKFMDAKDTNLRSGEITTHTWRDDDAGCNELVQAFGAARLVSDLRPDDFAKLRAIWTKKWSNVRVKKFVTIAREIFKFAFDNDIIDRPVKYGSGFETPSALTLRKDRAANGIRMFEADEIVRLLKAANQPLKAMILLGINAGLGNSDVGKLPMSALDLDGGWLNFPRPKTGIVRRCPLWPETVKAIREWLKQRPRPQDAAHAELVFLTAKGGSWSKETSDNPVSKETRKLLNELGIKGRRGFYSLRHSFETIGGDGLDQVGVNFIMGHVDPSMGAAYRERVADSRLQTVVDTVRAWLFAKPEKGKPKLRIAEEGEGRAATA